MFNGLRIIEDASLTEPYEDWSRVRSSGRARRRLKQGHRQNIVIRHKPKEVAYRIGDAFVMHPAMADLLRKQAAINGKEEK